MPDCKKLTRQISALFFEKLHTQVPSPDMDLIDTGLVDSLRFVEFLALLEQEFDVHVSVEDFKLDNFRTITKIASFVASKIQSGPEVSLQE